MGYRIGVIAGDGIGPEVTGASISVLEEVGLGLDFDLFEAGDRVFEERGEALPEETIEGALASDALLLGAVGRTAFEVVIRLRQELNTFVNLRPVKTLPGVQCLYPEVDIVIVRENTECLYKGLEEEVAPGVVTATRVITTKASRRIAQFGFDYAKENGWDKVSAVHKVNVLKKSCGLFLDAVREVAKGYEDVELEEVLVDAASLHLVRDPGRFQVLLTTNMFGDIISDLAAGLVGGLGLCPSGNIGKYHAMFEPVHGTAPDIAGKNIANPTACILSGCMMLDWLGEAEAARRVELALEKTLQEGLTTPDLGGELSTQEMARAVIDRLDTGGLK